MFRENMNPMAIIVAVDESGGFGKDGKIPWHFKEDFANFKRLTTGHICVMGRRTYQDMLRMKLERAKEPTTPINEILPGRESYVLTGAYVKQNLRDVVQDLKQDDKRTIFILGGFRMFVEAIAWVNNVYLTVVPGIHDCDVFFPMRTLQTQFRIVNCTQEGELKFVSYERNK